MSTPSERTIQDFGEQWTIYSENTGYYGSAALFADVFGPLVTATALAGCRVADIGAGTGRFVNVMLDLGVDHVVAVEPSAAFQMLKKNTSARAESVTYLNKTGEWIPPGLNLDYAFAIGVVHHIPEPLPVLVATRAALRPGGWFCAWLYGAEGNRPYLAVLSVLRSFSGSLPHAVLAALSWLLYWPLRAYIFAARWCRLPLRHYMREVLDKLDGPATRLVIYDQLNPAYAKYYSREEVETLFARAGYCDVELYHRHGYSWAVRAKNPER